MAISPSPALDETISPGQIGHIADSQVIAQTLNGLGGQGTEASKQSAATMIAAGHRTGYIWFSTDTKVTWRFDGTIWRPIAGYIGCKVYKTSSQSIPTGVGIDTALTWQGESATLPDTFGFFDPAQPDRLEVPAGYGGKFRVTVQACWAFSASGNMRRLKIEQPAIGFEGQVSQRPIVVSEPTFMQCTADVPIAAGQRVIAYGAQDTGGGLSVSSGEENSWFSIERIGD